MTSIVDSNWISLIPPLVALVLAFTTRQVLLALFAGVLAGGLVLVVQTGDLLASSIIDNFMLPALGSQAFATILLVYLWSLGGIIGMWEKTGGTQYFAKRLGNKIVHSARGSMVFGWIVSMIFHQGGTVSTVLTGTTVKPVADQHRVSHEELAYVIDSTASPVATLIPLNAWPIYIGGLVVGIIPIIPTTGSAYNFFIKSIPFNFYAICTVTITLLFALGWMPWIGKKMAAARKRARETGQLDGPDAKPLILPNDEEDMTYPGYNPSFADFLLPIIFLLFMTVTPFLLWRAGMIQQENANWINAAFLTAACMSMFLAFVRGMPLDEILDGFSRGCRSMTLGAIIIGLAIALGIVTNKVGTAQYLVQLTQDAIAPIALPAVLTVLCMIVAFATGTALGTYAVVFPIALPLAYSLNPDPFFIHVCFGAVLGGTVFGDQCSPISDTTILSSMFTGCDLMEHVRTQMPLALLSAGLATLLSTGVLIMHGL